MLAMKVARAATGRPALLKSIDGFHGSYDDLEVGLYDRPEIPDRVYLAPFGDAEAFEAQLAEHGEEIAAVVLEPMHVQRPRHNRAPRLPARQCRQAARRAGSLFVLDDCLMLRLAYGGSAERYALTPDLTFLGKFIGGGLPMGVLGGPGGCDGRARPAPRATPSTTEARSTATCSAASPGASASST